MAAVAQQMMKAPVLGQGNEVTLQVTFNELRQQWQGRLAQGNPIILFVLDKKGPVPDRPGIYECKVGLHDDGKWFFIGRNVVLFRLMEPRNLANVTCIDRQPDPAILPPALREVQMAEPLPEAPIVPPAVVERAKALGKELGALLAESAPASKPKREKAQKQKAVKPVEPPAVPKQPKKKKEGWEAKSRRHQEGVFGK